MVEVRGDGVDNSYYPHRYSFIQSIFILKSIGVDSLIDRKVMLC
ncbi:MAG: hypothetical protein HW388_1331 [Dehalococcoidia bacterium]|nr:hypothetical protein [Dehalococcoidia bacterium]